MTLYIADSRFAPGTVGKLAIKSVPFFYLPKEAAKTLEGVESNYIPVSSPPSSVWQVQDGTLVCNQDGYIEVISLFANDANIDLKYAIQVIPMECKGSKIKGDDIKGNEIKTIESIFVPRSVRNDPANIIVARFPCHKGTGLRFMLLKALPSGAKGGQATNFFWSGSILPCYPFIINDTSDKTETQELIMADALFPDGTQGAIPFEMVSAEEIPFREAQARFIPRYAATLAVANSRDSTWQVDKFTGTLCNARCSGRLSISIVILSSALDKPNITLTVGARTFSSEIVPSKTTSSTSSLLLPAYNLLSCKGICYKAGEPISICFPKARRGRLEKIAFTLSS